jgi:hypothetical protein
VLDTKLKNQLVQVDMHLGKEDVKFVKFSLNGKDCGVLVVDID